MRVLVAGWQGQIARALSEAAARRDDVAAYAVGRTAPDLTDRPSIGRTLFGISPDVIINTAAYTDVDGAEREPQIAHRRNSVGAAALARQAARIGIPIIHLSTVYVFDGHKTAPYCENDTTRPINAYGHSKSAGEAAVIRANPRHIILRTGWIFSPFGRNFITGILARSTSEKELFVDDTQTGSPGYAPHLASAILDIAARITAARTTPVSDDDIWGIYHIANRGTPTWCDLARAALGEITHEGNASPRVTPAAAAAAVASTDQARRPLNATLDCSKLENTFELTLPTWQEAVADCMRRLTTEAG